MTYIIKSGKRSNSLFLKENALIPLRDNARLLSRDKNSIDEFICLIKITKFCRFKFKVVCFKRK